MTIDDSLRRDLLTSSTGTTQKKKAEPTSTFDLDQLIISSSKQVLLKKIDFHPAEQEVSFCLQNLRGKYVPVNSSKERQNPGKVPVSSPGSMSTSLEDGKSDGIPKPKLVLFHPEKVRLEWQKCHRIGAGLINMGNTCFLNSTLQCLSYTPPLANYLLSHQHKEQCQMSGFCMLCELYNHLVRIGQHHGQAVRPMVIIHKLKHIAKHMHLGRQEDAHEFLRYVIEAMQRSSTYGYDKLDKFSKETSIVHQIFGGYYRSRVTCSLCSAISDTFDPFLDIGLDIKHVPSVNKALDRLIRPEMLDGDNKYKCGRCKRQVAAQKKFTIHRSSNVLTLCLKKFDFQRFGSGKLHKVISYPEVLNIRPYMSDIKGPPVMYNLYAVLTHQGASCNSGHYFCFVRAPNKMWYCMNDAHVSQASFNRVMNQDAYLLFYIRKPQGSSSLHKNGPKQSPKARLTVPFSQTPCKPVNSPSNQNGRFTGKQSEVQPPLITTPKSLPRPQPPFKSVPKHAIPSTNTTEVRKENMNRHQDVPIKSTTFNSPPRATPLPAKREKLSFSFKNQGVAGTLQTLKKEQRMRSELNQGSSKVESDINGKGKKISQKQKMDNLVKPKSNSGNAWGNTSQGGLVPYAADDSSESDSDENYDDVAKRLSQQAPRTPGSGQPSTSSSTSVTTADVLASTAGASSVNTGSEQATDDASVASLADSTDLTAIQSHDSPLKLTITTNGNAQRIKSTSTWHVSHSDSLISPSINSESSTGSVSSNSTQDWNVTDRPKDGSRKSRKENGSSSMTSHKHPSFPVMTKNGKGDMDRPGRGGFSEMKSPAMRQLSFNRDVHSDRDRTESKTLSPLKDPVTSTLSEDKGESGAADPSKYSNNHPMVNGIKESDPSQEFKKIALQDHEKTTSDFVKDRNFQHVEERHSIKCETLETPLTTSQKQNNDKDIGAKSVKREESKQEVSHRATPTMFSSSGIPDKSKFSGIKERLTDKIAKHKNKKKKRRRGSESDEEELLSDDNHGERKKQTKSGNYEWYVVKEGEEEEDGKDALKRKKKKRKRKQKDTKVENIHQDSRITGGSIADDREKENLQRGKEMGKYREKVASDSDSERDSLPFQKKSKLDKAYSSFDSYQQHTKRNISSSDSEGSMVRARDKGRYDSSSTESSRKDHKAKKRKRKDRERKPLLQDSEDEDDDEEEFYSSQRKKKYFHTEREESRQSNHHQKYRKHVQEQNWDYHLKDTHKKTIHDKSTFKGSVPAWDGRFTGSDDVVHHLTKSSFGGYGSLVPSWDGGKSLVDEEAEKDSKEAKRRDSYNDEFDQGKVKKVKKKVDEEESRNWRFHHRNPFQHFQSIKNKGKQPFWNRRHSGSGYHRFGHSKSHSWHRSNWR